MTINEIADELELYTAGRLKKANVQITVEELQKYIDEIKKCHATLEQVMWERDMAITQLKELGYGFGEKIKTDKDAISRQYLLDNCVVDKVTMPYVPVSKIENAPPVTPQPKTGHWISIEECTDWYDATYKCSCCGRQIITPYELSKNLYEQYPYCHCGAKMVEPQESEE